MEVMSFDLDEPSRRNMNVVIEAITTLAQRRNRR
jgi:hypothetical protein